MPHWTHITIHHSWTGDTTLPDVVGIKNFHTSYRQYGNIITEDEYYAKKAHGEAGLSKPWMDIGYHWLIERLKDMPAVIRGRSMMYAGAHCREQSMNRRGIGICFVGNFDEAPPPEDILELGADFCAWLCRMYHIPVENIEPHNKYATYKTCPGTEFDMVYFRERTQDYLARWGV